MSVRIRLQRTGSKKKPCYRVVAVDSRKKRDGIVLENLGQYQPIVEDENFHVNSERVIDWLKKGATPSNTIEQLLKKAKIWEQFKNVSNS